MNKSDYEFFFFSTSALGTAGEKRYPIDPETTKIVPTKNSNGGYGGALKYREDSRMPAKRYIVIASVAVSDDVEPSNAKKECLQR
mmetsp:Transcript_40921/g.55757  ORF Transcript_40921/g.55757 Transcript_40921/m.55757 type:complete len:85 (-) Transcript_40921:510-764(-)